MDIHTYQHKSNNHTNTVKYFKTYPLTLFLYSTINRQYTLFVLISFLILAKCLYSYRMCSTCWFPLLQGHVESPVIPNMYKYGFNLSWPVNSVTSFSIRIIFCLSRCLFLLLCLSVLLHRSSLQVLEFTYRKFDNFNCPFVCFFRFLYYLYESLPIQM